MIKTLLAIVFFLTVVNTYSQADTNSAFDFNKKISSYKLKSDLRILRDSLQIIHPALYRFSSKHGFDSAFKSAYKELDRPQTQVQFYRIASSLISRVGDIHTMIETSDESLNFLTTKGELFPFDVRIINKDVFIASNNSADTTIEVGSRILKINNKPIEKVIGDLLATFSDEGMNETLKLKRVEQRFAFQYYLIYGQSKTFKVEYSTGDAVSQTKTITAQPFSVIKERRAKNQLKFPGLKSLFTQPPYLAFSVEKDQNVAILTVKWFQNDVLQGNNESFKPFIDSIFKEIRSENIGNLVIDIRNNGGGESENASYLYSYLTNKPFRFLYAMDTNEKTYAEDAKRGIKYSAEESGNKYQTTDSSTTYKQFFGLDMQQPSPLEFSGKVCVLIDGLTTSAATQFAALVKLNRRGLLIGEESPGSLLGGSGRGYSYFYLPNSGLLTMISHYRLYMADPATEIKDSNIIPDYRPRKSMTDLLNGIDVDLRDTLELIRKPDQVMSKRTK